MLQKLPGPGYRRQRRLRRRLPAPISRAPNRTGAAFSRRGLSAHRAATLEGIARVTEVSFQTLPVEVITAPALRLDTVTDRQRLSKTVEHLRPILLILDPLIRLHRVDENDATQIAALLSFLRELQRKYHLAVILVHHARKDSNGSRPGQALRGSSELHGWGDSNLYMRRKGPQLTLSTEHRAAASQDHIPLELAESSGLALRVLDQPCQEPDSAPTPVERVRNTLAQLKEPAPVQHLRKLCGMRTAAVCSALNELSKTGEVIRDLKGYQLNLALFPVSLPMDPQGNGNGKHPDDVQ